MKREEVVLENDRYKLEFGGELFDGNLWYVDPQKKIRTTSHAWIFYCYVGDGSVHLSESDTEIPFKFLTHFFEKDYLLRASMLPLNLENILLSLEENVEEDFKLTIRALASEPNEVVVDFLATSILSQIKVRSKNQLSFDDYPPHIVWSCINRSAFEYFVRHKYVAR